MNSPYESIKVIVQSNFETNAITCQLKVVKLQTGKFHPSRAFYNGLRVTVQEGVHSFTVS